MSLFDALPLPAPEDLRGMGILFYDLETKLLPPGQDVPPGVRTCRSWGDYRGMGISVLVSHSLLDGTTRVFMDDNLDDFTLHASEHAHVIGFNSVRFDDKVLEAHGCPVRTTYDLLTAISAAAKSIPWPTGSGRRSYKLGAMAEANGCGSKLGSGALAPLLYQRRRYGELVTYCIQDVMMTRDLFLQRESLVCPNTGHTFALDWKA